MKNDNNAHCNITNIKQYIPNADVIFEIGAHDGRDIDLINSLWDSPTIHCFEPDPEPYKILKDYESKNVICNNVGLNYKTGTSLLYKIYNKHITDQATRNDFFKTAQSLYPINLNYHRYDNADQIDIQSIEVPVITINDYCSINNVLPNILLIDTQGSEYDILRGADNILSNNNLKGIILEWSEEELYVSQPLFKDIQEYLLKHNFVLKEKINLWSDIHGDAIFLRP